MAVNNSFRYDICKVVTRDVHLWFNKTGDLIF